MRRNVTGVWMVCAALVSLLLAGCGGGGGEGSAAALSSSSPGGAPGSYVVTEDGYGLQNATFLVASRTGSTLVMRAAIASGMTDPNFRTVIRIDISQPSSIVPGSYSVGDGAGQLPAFPGEINVFNGHPSSALTTSAGTITFTSYGASSGDVIAGSFEVAIEDRNFPAVTPPSYPIKVAFRHVLNTSGAIVPTPSPVPAGASSVYDANCASCHTLGGYHQAGGGGPDIALRGGELTGMFTAGTPGHKNITLTAAEISDLRVLLNAN